MNQYNNNVHSDTSFNLNLYKKEQNLNTNGTGFRLSSLLEKII